jgi:hypothetical protein
VRRRTPLLGPLFALVVLARLTDATSAHADVVEEAEAPPENQHFGLSRYEQESLDLVLAKLHVRVDPAPEGKRAEAIVTERLDVFEQRDFLPDFALLVNGLHATSHARVIEREVLVAPGERYTAVAVAETARNLRALPQLSLVLVVPIAGSTPDSVRILVVTKDVWSLRLQWDFSLTRGGFERFILQPAEINLGGVHQTLGATAYYQPLSTSLGARYAIPRILSSRVSLSASANVIVNNESGATEGSFGAISATQPLYSARTEWAWGASAQWRDEITRRYTDARLAHFGPATTPPSGRIPEAFRSDVWQAQAALVRSFGWARKNDFTLSLEASHTRYDAGDLSAYDPALVRRYAARRLPVSDDRFYPAVEWRTYTTHYAAVTDLETLSLQEDYRTGPFACVKVYPVSQNLGSTRTFFGLFAEAGYTRAIGDGLLRVEAQSTSETNTRETLQGMIAANLYVASPRTPLGRVVYSAQLVDRYANYLNQKSAIGGNNRLRGFATNALVGDDAIASNLEFRTRPVDVLKVQLGAVAFYDVDDALDRFSDVRL